MLMARIDVTSQIDGQTDEEQDTGHIDFRKDILDKRLSVEDLDSIPSQE